MEEEQDEWEDGGDIRRILGKQVMQDTAQNSQKTKNTKKLKNTTQLVPKNNQKPIKSTKTRDGDGRNTQQLPLKNTNKHTKTDNKPNKQSKKIQKR